MGVVGKSRRWRWVGLVLGAVALAAVALFMLADRPLPQGSAGPEAEVLARRMQAAVDTDAWERTGAVRWTFAGRNAHLWDRQRHLARVRWGEMEVLVDLNRRRGLAWRDGQRLPPAEAETQVQKAWRTWANDSFWFNPVAKLFDPGVERRIIPLPGGENGLLVTYTGGGATPGDSYLWYPGADGRPAAWRMWVSIIPIGGVEATWEGWARLRTGAYVSTRHRLPLITLEITEVEGAATLAELEAGEDPFAPLSAYLETLPVD